MVPRCGDGVRVFWKITFSFERQTLSTDPNRHEVSAPRSELTRRLVTLLMDNFLLSAHVQRGFRQSTSSNFSIRLDERRDPIKFKPKRKKCGTRGYYRVP